LSWFCNKLELASAAGIMKLVSRAEAFVLYEGCLVKSKV